MSRVVVMLIFLILSLSGANVANLKGELSVDQGALNYSIPLNLPAGVAGVKPELSLNYNSNGGNGYYGQGWDLSAGASLISRCGSNLALDGKVRGIKYDSGDNLCLDGQRLVLVSGSRFGYNSEYRTKIDSYNKIIYYGDSIKVWTKSGDIYEYKKYHRVWLLSKISDRYSNSINYHYSGDNTERYLSSITYADNKIQLNYGSRKDIFNGYSYGQNRKLTKRVNSIDIKSENKTLRTYKLSYASQSSELDKSILQSFTECSGGECLKPLKFNTDISNRAYFNSQTIFNSGLYKGDFTYQDGWRVNSHPRDLVDLTDDGLLDIVGFGSGNVYVAPQRSVDFMGTKSPLRSFVYNHGWRVNSHQREFADLNSDGLKDIVGFKNDGVWVSYNQGVNSYGYPQFKNPIKILRYSDNTRDWSKNVYLGKLGDMNGDGLVDIVSFKNNGVYISYNNNSGLWVENKVDNVIKTDWYKDRTFYHDTKYKDELHMRNDSAVLPKNAILLDIDRDGLKDLVGIVSNGSVYVSYNNGNNSFTKPIYTTKHQGYMAPRYIGYRHRRIPIKFDDINGDGLLDFIYFTYRDVQVTINQGKRTYLGRAQTVSNKFATYTPSLNTNWDNNNAIREVADMNGDGLVDLVGFGKDGVYVSYNKGSLKFDSPIKITSEFGYQNGWSIDKHLRVLKDIDGDGSTDIVGFASSNIKILRNRAKTYRLTKITDSFNNLQSIDYHRYQGSSTVGTNYPTLGIHSLPKVVTSVTVRQQDGSIPKSIVNYTYEGLKANLRGLGSFGFAKVTTTNSLDNSKNITEFMQNYPYVGLVKSSKAYLDDELISQSSNKFINRVQSNTYQIFNTSTTTKSYQDGRHIKTTIDKKVDFDEYGNPESIVSETIDEINNQSFKKITYSEYENDDSEWILSRLKKATVTHQAYGDTKVKSSSFTYNSDTGILKSETIEPDSPKALTKSYEYDSKGNKIKETISVNNITDRVTRYEYDPLGKFNTKVVNALGHSESRSYNVDGQLLSVIGPNGLTTSWKYDNFGKKIEEKRADGTKTTYNYSFNSSISKSYYAISIQNSGLAPVTTYYNSLDQKIKTRSKDFSGKYIYQDFYYDKFGNNYKTSTPYIEDEEPQYKEFEYDKYQRVIAIKEPSPDKSGIARSSIEYDGLVSTITNAKNQTKVTKKNILDKTIYIKDEMGAEQRYEYNALGKLVKTIDSASNEIVLRYDIFGNKIYQNDPDMGEWRYEYNALGELTKQTDAKGQSISFSYDKLGRKVKEVSREGTKSWEYDSRYKGKLTKESKQGFTKEYYYDKLGRVTATKTNIDNKAYTQRFTYDHYSRLVNKTLPNNFKLIHTYNNQGHLESIKSPKEQIKDFDEDHFKNLIDNMLTTSLEYYKKSLELDKKVISLQHRAKYYQDVANRYISNSSYKEYLLKQAKRLMDNSYRLEYFGNKYKRLSRIYRYKADNYMRKFERYKKRWYSKWIANFYGWLANRYYRYSANYAALSGNYLRWAVSTRSASYRYKYYSRFNHNSWILKKNYEYYTRLANNALNELKRVKELTKNLKKRANSQEDVRLSQSVNIAYSQILRDNNYNYFYKVLEKDSFGRTTKYISGNGLVTTNNYDESGVLESSKTGYTFDSAIRELSYEYDSLANLTQRNDDKLRVSSRYEYDDLNRVTSADIYLGKESLNLSYQYDTLGNMTYKSDVGDYTYDSTKPHQVIQAGAKRFSYDSNGNMTQNNSKKIVYDAYNKPISIETKNSTINFKYDTNNQRYKKESNKTTTHYLGKSYEYSNYKDGSKEERYFINIGGKVISIYTNKTDKKGIFKPTTKYLHYDSLNSVDTITNNLGVVEERFAYKPFGQRLNLDVNGNLTNKESHTNRGYTGHEHIEDSSLIHMNGRVYDSSIARFISADPHIQSPYNTQSYNRYSYTLNNPLKYTDPSGFFFKKLFKSIKKHIKTIVTIAVVAVVAVATAGAGLALASAMGLSGIASTIVAGAVGGAIAGFTGGAVGTLLHGGSLGSAFRNGLKGAAYGAIGGAFAGGIGHYFGHSASLFTPGSAGVGSAFTKAVAHGISRAGIAKARGHKVSAGFWSGFVSSFFSVGTEGYGGVAGRTTIMAIAGGTVAKHTGGKFANGAVSAAFVHLFNAEMGNTLARRNEQIRLKNMTDKDFKKEMGFKGTNDDIWISKIKLNNQIFKNSLSDLKTLTINGISIPTPKPDVSFVTKIINFFDTTSSLKFHYNCRRASSCNVYIYE